MTAYDFLLWGPVVSAVTWLFVASYQIVQERYRTWTEIFFVGLCLAVGAYGLSDAFFFNVSTDWMVQAGAVASLTSFTFAALFAFLYGMTLHSRFRRIFLVALIPVVFFVGTIPDRMFARFVSLSGGGAPYVPVYNPPWFDAWVVATGTLVALGAWGVYRTYREVHAVNPHLSRRLFAILLGVLIAAILGAATNMVLALVQVALPPLFSTTLVIPGVLLFFAVSPSTLQRLDAAILRRKAAGYRIKAAFLSYSDGTVIGSKKAPEEQMIDADSFGATLDVIQNFMRTSFPTLRGKWLQSIRHGDYTLVMERARHAYVTVVLEGVENDQLRRQMIRLLEEFEARNRRVLDEWRGLASDAVGVDAMLEILLAGG